MLANIYFKWTGLWLLQACQMFVQQIKDVRILVLWEINPQKRPAPLHPLVGLKQSRLRKVHFEREITFLIALQIEWKTNSTCPKLVCTVSVAIQPVMSCLDSQ